VASQLQDNGETVVDMSGVVAQRTAGYGVEWHFGSLGNGFCGERFASAGGTIEKANKAAPFAGDEVIKGCLFGGVGGYETVDCVFEGGFEDE
jgi:hypothetical protein